jgi:hypothetical protein
MVTVSKWAGVDEARNAEWADVKQVWENKLMYDYD